MLIDIKVEHHLQAFAKISEILEVRIRKNICLPKDDCPALTPGKEFAESRERVIFLARPRLVCALRRNYKRNHVHAKAIDTKLPPETHYLQNLSLHLRMACVEVRLKIVETMKVVRLRCLLIVPGRLLHAREDDTRCGVFRFLLRPHIPLAIL